MDNSEPPSHPVDRGWAWLICLSAAVANFFVNGGTRTVGLLFVELLVEFQADQGVTALVLAFMAAGFAVFSAIGNVIGTIFTMRIACLVGAIFTFLGMFLTAFATNIYIVILSLGMLSGIGYGFMFGPSMVMVGRYFEKRRSLANGLAVAGGSIGQLLLPLFINHVMITYTFRGAILLYSALLLHCIPASMLLRPTTFYKPKTTSELASKSVSEQVQHNRQILAVVAQDTRVIRDSLSLVKPESSQEPDKTTEQQDGTTRRRNNSIYYHPLQEFRAPSVEYISSMTNVPPTKVTVGMAICAFCTKLCDPELLRNSVFLCFSAGLSFGHSGYLDNCIFVPPYSLELWQNNRTRAAILISIMGMADLIGRIAGGWFSDLRLVRRPFIVGFSFVVSGVATIFVPVYPVFAVLIIYSITLGLLGGTYMAQVVVLVTDLFGLEKLPTGLGLSTMIMGLFFIPVPPFLGKVQERTGSYGWSLRASAVLLIVGGVLFLMIPLLQRLQQKKKNKDEQREAAENHRISRLYASVDWNILPQTKESDI